MSRTVLAVALLLPGAALAHTGIGAHGAPLVSGLAHPLLGPDHLLAMIAVGLFAAMSGGAARWACPASFLGAMLAGGALGYGGAPLPVIEPTILASVVVLGAAIAFALRPPLPIACAAIALFGLAHGYAHGLEGPALGGLLYGAGFVAATAALHGLGLLLGGNAGRPAVARALGGLTCLAGLALVLG
jgi:urease accessory protein